MNINLNDVEKELKKRLKFSYSWGRKQNNHWDALSNFIYNIDNFDNLIIKIKSRFSEIKSEEISYNELFNYSINRWYNFWSAMAVEKIFCSMPGVTPNKNEKDKLVDFSINGINFDHKTSIFPGNYPNSFDFAKKHPNDLIKWLYNNQSKQRRKHYKNRLFIILYKKDDLQHWKLKAEISWLKDYIINYIVNFDQDKLNKFYFNNNDESLSDIIWAIK